MLHESDLRNAEINKSSTLYERIFQRERFWTNGDAYLNGAKGKKKPLMDDVDGMLQFHS